MTTDRDRTFRGELLCETAVVVVALLGASAALAGGFYALEGWLHPETRRPVTFPPPGTTVHEPMPVTSPPGIIVTIPAR
jgi:hypothetical protein